MKQRIFFVILCVVLVVFAAYAAVVESGWTRTSNPGIARTNLATHNANNITINTISDARLSANVSLLGQSITEAEIDISNLPDTELLINQAGSLDTIPQTTFATPAGVSNIVQANGGGFFQTNASAPNSVKTTNDITFEGDLEIEGGLIITGAGYVATPKLYTGDIESTNSSSLTLTAGGDSLTLSSDSATYNGSGGFGGIGANLTYTGTANNGNLATSVNTLQELNDAVDNLSLGSGGGGSSNSSYTNITVYTADNDPDAGAGPALTLRPLESRTTPGGAAVLLEALPPYNPAGFKGRYRHIFSVVTNTFGDLRPDVINSWGYNIAGNSNGVSSFGLTDTNEPSWLMQRESRWQNGAGLSQLEAWESFTTPYTDYGTNFGMRWIGANLVWDTVTREYVSADGTITLGLFDFINPRGGGLQGVRISGASATSRSMNQSVWGTITTHTNDAGIGGFRAEGGLVAIGSSPSVGEYVNHLLDWKDASFGIGTNNFFVYPTAAQIIYNIGSQVAAANFMQINLRSNTTVYGKFNVVGTLGMYGLIPSGGASNAAGSRVAYLSDVSGGTGSNGLSYVNYPAVRTIADDVVQVLATNGTAVFTVTNSTGTVAINAYAGNTVFKSTQTTTTIDSAGSNTEIREGGVLAIDVGLNFRRIYAGDGTTVSAEFGDATAPIFGGITLDLDAIADGKTLVREGNSIVGNTAQVGSHTAPSTSNPLAPTWNDAVHMIWYGATGEIDLPVASGYAKRGVIIYNTGAFTITIDPNGSEVIVRDGTVQTGGVTMTLSSGAGNYVSLICDGVRWVTLGFKGTLAAGS